MILFCTLNRSIIKKVMKRIFPFFIFSVIAIITVILIGYFDDGHSENYSSFLYYLQTDALSDNIQDYARHIYTLLFIGIMTFAYFILKNVRQLRNKKVYLVLISVLSLPVSLSLFVLMLYLL